MIRWPESFAASPSPSPVVRPVAIATPRPLRPTANASTSRGYFFVSPAAERTDRSRLETAMDSVAVLTGRVMSSPQTLLAALRSTDRIQILGAATSPTCTCDAR